MAARRKKPGNKVGKGKARKRSTPRTKQSRPRQHAAKTPMDIFTESIPALAAARSPVKSPPSEQEIENQAAEILEKLDSAAVTKRDLETTRRRRFIEEFLISGNGAQAAILAGFSPNRAKQTAHDLLADPVIAAEIASRQSELNKKLQITQERVLTEQAAIAFSDVGEIMGEDPDTGSPVIRKFADWPPGARKAIRSVKVKRVVPKKDEEERPFEILEFGLWDKPTALEKLSARLDSEKGANAGVDLANLSDKERLRIIAEVLSRGRAARDAVMKGKKKTA